MNNLFSPHLLWMIPAALAAGVLIRHFWSNRLAQPPSRGATKALAERTAAAYDEPGDLVSGTVLQVMADSLSRKVRTWLARASQIIVSIPALDAKVGRLEADRDMARERRTSLEARSRDAGEIEPYITARSAAALNLLLAGGDVMIVSAAISAADANLRDWQSAALALAFGITLFAIGKLGGDMVRDQYGVGTAPFVLAGFAASFSIGLYLLRSGVNEAWLFLAMAPAIGAAGVTLLGPSRNQKNIQRARLEEGRASKRIDRTIAKRDGRIGKAAYLHSRVGTVLTREALRARSYLAMAGKSQEALPNFRAESEEIGFPLCEPFTNEWGYPAARPMGSQVLAVVPEQADPATDANSVAPDEDEETPEGGTGTTGASK